jgi:hypothetical protein
MALRIANAPTAAGRRSVTCRAAAPQPAAPGRRAALGALLGAASLALAAPRRALALIPDEEDEELLERAKANRAARLQKNQEVTRAFIKEEGLTNKQLDSELIPVQKAITKLAQSGGWAVPLQPRHATAGATGSGADACPRRAIRAARAMCPAPRTGCLRRDSSSLAARLRSLTMLAVRLSILATPPRPSGSKTRMKAPRIATRPLTRPPAPRRHAPRPRPLPAATQAPSSRRTT